MLLASGISATQASYIAAKAYLAQWLMEHTWTTQTLVTQHPAKPWSWADISTTAKLSYRLNEDADTRSLIVLDNASGEAMAFGPGLVAGELSDAANSTIALGGHRDTHLAFLEQADKHTEFELQIPDGSTLRYQFVDSFIANSQTQQLKIAKDIPGLVLITCYPFNAVLPGGPQRLVVRAQLIDK